jgi:hypothetical protein
MFDKENTHQSRRDQMRHKCGLYSLQAQGCAKGAVLNNWHSDMGKAGYCAVTDFWQGDPATAEDCADHVFGLLEGLHFVYKSLDSLVSHVSDNQSTPHPHNLPDWAWCILFRPCLKGVCKTPL